MLGEDVPKLRLMPVDGEKALLELFAPDRTGQGSNNQSTRPETRALWRADAIHRAKNLSQLTSSLANVVEHRSTAWSTRSMIVDARTLSRAYDELGHHESSLDSVPCAPLLGEIASRLILLFGRARGIIVNAAAQPIALTPHKRRALVLICSELVINALKYGSTAFEGGEVSIRLEIMNGYCRLVVQDNGDGDVNAHLPGHGNMLLLGLADILGATVVRSPSDDVRRGYCVTVSFAVDDTRADPST